MQIMQIQALDCIKRTQHAGSSIQSQHSQINDVTVHVTPAKLHDVLQQLALAANKHAYARKLCNTRDTLHIINRAVISRSKLKSLETLTLSQCSPA
jgi:hypothetical protein